ncbi:uncharacterized protein LOC131426489 [Malaya genurostris]|uniref:uncharacterized protein LOC131426489 n=1 Tax=Malaya genurostris TaxID=325434 RepID=UPI0026F37DEF|nr:uncharacterized protein LOC131426489 [Malaya genurostris]XP_058445243.1 uncharacterized protein LOC131426489 [Malaya genurostris]XP_058445244.1 uncharacterized protein LOC131426489 [Malaya genurostris]XP_058445245.1 uncharacterized protein LOC131426489 [Malaya genurostris]XP_058445246.1 uncharacterized protein LOC131426489 [Malaya genurostris]XP_058445247.1 uncharacterized protein LOC131426489 [Malaya genurostris]
MVAAAAAEVAIPESLSVKSSSTSLSTLSGPSVGEEPSPFALDRPLCESVRRYVEEDSDNLIGEKITVHSEIREEDCEVGAFENLPGATSVFDKPQLDESEEISVAAEDSTQTKSQTSIPLLEEVVEDMLDMSIQEPSSVDSTSGKMQEEEIPGSELSETNSTKPAVISHEILASTPDSTSQETRLSFEEEQTNVDQATVDHICQDAARSESSLSTVDDRSKSPSTATTEAASTGFGESFYNRSRRASSQQRRQVQFSDICSGDSSSPTRRSSRGLATSHSTSSLALLRIQQSLDSSRQLLQLQQAEQQQPVTVVVQRRPQRSYTSRHHRSSLILP